MGAGESDGRGVAELSGNRYSGEGDARLVGRLSCESGENRKSRGVRDSGYSCENSRPEMNYLLWLLFTNRLLTRAARYHLPSRDREEAVFPAASVHPRATHRPD